MYSPEEFFSAHGSACNHALHSAACRSQCHSAGRQAGWPFRSLSTVLTLTATLVLSACTSSVPVKTALQTQAGATQSQTSAVQQQSNENGRLDARQVFQWFEQARDIVARDQQVDLSNLTAEVADERKIATHARASLLGALSHDLTNADFAESLVDNILNAQTASVLAIYSPEQRKILLHQDNLMDYLRTSRKSQSGTRQTATRHTAQGDKAAIQALLIHELIHASDHVRHNAFAKNNGSSYQEVFAKSTIIEGHAQWQTRRICKLAGCSDAFKILNQYMFEVDVPADPALEYVQNRNFKNLEFVYKEGERFIDSLMKRPNGPTLVENSAKPWSKRRKGTLKRNVLAAAAFSVNPEARRPIVDFYTTKVLATAKHEYYDRNSDTPIPIAIIALQTDTINTATNTAELIFDSTSQTYNNLNGTLVALKDWQTSKHTANIERAEKYPLRIDMYTASGHMNNGMINAEYPIEVVTATAGNFIVHIDGRYSGGKAELMQLAGQLLSTLAR